MRVFTISCQQHGIALLTFAAGFDDRDWCRGDWCRASAVLSLTGTIICYLLLSLASQVRGAVRYLQV